MKLSMIFINLHCVSFNLFIQQRYLQNIYLTKSQFYMKKYNHNKLSVNAQAEM